MLFKVFQASINFGERPNAVSFSISFPTYLEWSGRAADSIVSMTFIKNSLSSRPDSQIQVDGLCQ